MTKILLAALVAGALVVPAWAQNVDEGDDPDHGVARISVLQGDVNVQRGDSGEVVAAELNAPVVALDHVLTGPNSRAEVQFDSSNMIRLGPVSEVRIGDLRDNDYFIQIAEGTTTFRVLRESNAQVEISTPTVSVRPTEAGIYRVTVRPDGATEVTVRSGRAEISTPRGIEVLQSGKTMQARGTAEDPEFMILSAISRDDWDSWNENRDRDLQQQSKSYQYVSNNVPGAYDLDNNGRWVYDSPYGWVWVPNVANTWAPYRVGRWSWVNYYGWTWISGDPWGWAPYHYGSWYSSSYGWAWYPGNISNRYYWRPALVSFFGWGNGSFNLGVGFGGGTFGYGNVGWVPLAPYERYNPWYGSRYRGGYNNITIINNTNIVNNYRNARQFNGRDGITSVQAGNFGRGRVDNANFVRATNNDLTRAGRVQGPMGFSQDRDSRRYSDRTPTPDVSRQINQTRDRQFASVATNADRSRRVPNLGGVVNGGPGNAGNRSGNAVDRAGVTRGATANPNPDRGTANGRRFDQGNTSGTVNADRGANVREIGSARNAGNYPTPNVQNGSQNPVDTRSRRGVEFAPRSQQPQQPQNSSSVDNGNRRGSSQPVQINPPIVRDRGNVQQAVPRSATPNYSTPYDRGRAAPSAPPQQAAPPQQQSFPGATRGNGGGGVERGAAPAPAPAVRGGGNPGGNGNPGANRGGGGNPGGGNRGGGGNNGGGGRRR